MNYIVTTKFMISNKLLILPYDFLKYDTVFYGIKKGFIYFLP